MKRLFYYSGYRFTVFHWINGKFTGSYYFDPTDAGRDEFAHYLQKMPAIPSRILVDVIEEDFRIESIPHAYGSDRRALVQRQIERFFRSSSEYTWHAIYGREKDGRRDDRLFIAALTNPNMLQPWLSLIAAANVPIRGIWSLPLLSSKILPYLKATQGNVFLISQQVSSNMRFSHFKDGKLQSSRSTTINLEGTDYAHFISEQIEQTARYLTNKRIMTFDEKLSVHIITPEDFFDSVVSTCVSQTYRDIHVHSVHDIEKSIHATGVTGPYGNGIFAQLCSNDLVSRGHYGGTRDFAIYNRYLMRQTLLASALAAVVGSLMFGSWLYFDEARMQTEMTEFNRQTSRINQQYQQQLEKLEPVLAQTGMMRSSVELAQRIKINKQISPQQFMVTFSQLFSHRQFDLLEIVQLDWKVMAVASANDAVPVHVQAALQHQVTVYGKVPLSAENIRVAVDQVNDLVAALREDKRILQVDIKKLPIDTRSSGQLSLQAGSEAKTDNASNSGEFVLSLLMRGEST